MSKLLYSLNGFDNIELKQVYITSLPNEIQSELEREIALEQKSLVQISVGEIHQKTMIALEKICEQHTYWSRFMNRDSKFNKLCQKPYMQIK